MRKVCWIVLLGMTLPLWAEQSPLDLMLQGQFGEARRMIAKSDLSPRYELLYYAMTESDAARACSLYQVIAIRYASTDCDIVARDRLEQARSMGFEIAPIAEWKEAAEDIKPLFAQKAAEPSPAMAATAAKPEGTTQTPVIAGFGEDEEVVTPPMPETPKAEEPAPIVVTAPAEPSAPVGTPVPSPIPVVAEQPAPVEPPAPIETPVSTSVPVVTDEPAPLEASVPVATPKMAEAAVQPLGETLRPHDRPATTSSGGRWYIQVGAFGLEDNARRLAAKLEKDGYTVKLVPMEGKKRLMQVRVGGYGARNELPPVMSKLKDQYNVPTVVVAE